MKEKKEKNKKVYHLYICVRSYTTDGGKVETGRLVRIRGEASLSELRERMTELIELECNLKVKSLVMTSINVLPKELYEMLSESEVLAVFKQDADETDIERGWINNGKES